jgi:UDP-glucose 4-epimerase
VALRYFNVFGARQDPKSEYAAVIPRFITAMLAGQGVTIFGDGEQSRDFCYIDNTVEANLKAGDAPASQVSGRMVNVACGAATTLNEVVKLLGEISGKKIPVAYEPARVGDVKHSLADITEAKTRLGYVGAVSFADGLKRTVDWYASKR